MTMVTKLVHLQKIYENLQTLKLHDLMLVTRQIEKIIPSLLKDLKPLNLSADFREGVQNAKA